MRRQAKPAPPALARHSRNVVRIWPYQCRGKRGVRKQATVMSVAAEYLPAVHAASGLDLNQAPPEPDGIGNIINPVCVLYYDAWNHANPERACKIGRAACRERVGRYVQETGVAVKLKKKQKKPK